MVESDTLDSQLFGGADQLLAGVPIGDILPITCLDSKRQFKGVELNTFARLPHLCEEHTRALEQDKGRILEVVLFFLLSLLWENRIKPNCDKELTLFQVSHDLGAFTLHRKTANPSTKTTKK